MPKQVRIRRGTTAQHTAFVGADGEVTFDSTKKVLVVHDGVTAGGKPVDGFVKLDPGAPMSQQEIKTCVAVTGGDSDTDSFTVQYPARFASQVIVDDTFMARRIQLQQETLPYAGSVALDFATFGQKLINLTGNLSLTGVNMQNGRQLVVRLKTDASLRTLAFPGWHFIGAAAPASLAASKVAMLWLWCFGGGDTDVMAHYLAEP